MTKHSAPPDQLSGLFRSEIYYNQRNYDTTWLVSKTPHGYEVVIKECKCLQDRFEDCFSLRYDKEFKDVLLKRTAQIKEANK